MTTENLIKFLPIIALFLFLIILHILYPLYHRIKDWKKNKRRQKETFLNQGAELKALKVDNKVLNDRILKMEAENKKLISNLTEEMINMKNNFINAIDNLTQEKERLVLLVNEKDELYNSLYSKDNNLLTKISSLSSDFVLAQFTLSANYLSNKYKPAIKEAKRIRELKNESKQYLENYRLMHYKFEALLQLFPELNLYIEDFETIQQLENIKDIETLKEDFDRTLFYLTKEEYLQLDEDQRNQLALDRYLDGSKTNWQIGRDYELFCGYELERKGWEVEYMGMEKKLNDMGRDLIAKKGNKVLVIQCKYWSKRNVIHEKHITQLYGTTVEYLLNTSSKSVKVHPVFITNIELSEIAKKFAEKLKVKVETKDLSEFPRIKCNINRDKYGKLTKIYHLPFDQQYDRTKIINEGEFLAYTVREAVNKGFRRAYRYYGS